jgi:hypothetical protein
MNTIFAGSNGLIGGIIIFLVLGSVVGFAYMGTSLSSKVLSESLSVPLDSIKSARIDINTDEGNLTIDRLKSGERLLANGTLQYSENQALPTRTLDSVNGQAVFSLKGGKNGQHSFRFPWMSSIGAIEWQIHFNPMVLSDITAHSGGGNVKLDLNGMTVSRVSADTGGGNMEVDLPDNAANLNVFAKSGAGNVTVEIGSAITGNNIINANSGAGNVAVHIPNGMVARVYATSGMGKVIVDSRFSKTDKNTYQSANYDGAVNKVEITVTSGAGNVSVNTR